MFKKNVLVHALALAFGGAALTAGMMGPAMAQSNATGTIYGQVSSPSGATVVIHNVETGLRRNVTLDGQGRYQATSLPPGHYRVELTRNGKMVQASETDVLLGQGADVSFAATAPTTVVVTGRRTRIDVSNTNNGAVFTAKELARLPVQTNLTAVALLAPNTTKADRAYGGASFGGSGASENSYYVNGFPMTNPMTQLGSVELPFGAIANSEVITGGFGAEFGRSIGGVLNVTTKSGTNNWEVGVMTSYTPDKLRAKEANYYYGMTGDAANAGTDGKLHYRHDNSYTNVEQNGIYVGGPLIKDKLFMFLAGDETTTRRGFLTDSVTGNTGGVDSTTLGRDGWSQRKQLQQRYVARFDWNITDNHRLEWTSVGDNNHEKRQTYGYVLNPNNPNAKAQLDGSPNGVMWSELDTKNPGASGADVNMLKYTGNLTDDLTVTGLYGEMKGDFGVTYTGFGANPPPSISLPSVSRRVPALDAQNLYVNYNKFPGNVGIPGSSDVKALRLDLEYKLGTHTLRVGLDHVKIAIVNAGVARSGGATWTYQKVADPTASTRLASGQSGIVGNFGGYGTQGYYASKSLFSSITDASEVQSAQYLEDKWQVTKDFVLKMGIRNDSYSNSNGDGEKFIDKKKQIAPRLSASWDVNGDQTLKVFGSAGRYFLQLPTQVAARAASRSTLTRQDFTYTGIDPATGVPTGLTAINQPFSPDGEYGQKKNPQSVVVKDLKSNYQDEITLGFEKAFSPQLNFGVKGTYRKLGAGIDDNCDTRRTYQFALDHGIPVVGMQYMPCYIFNPGEDATIWVDGHDAAGNPIVSGKGQYAHFTAAELGNPKAERKYAALDFFVEHPFRNGWYAKMMYTLSRSKGNMEGQTRSDTGQTDIATTAAWDFPEFAPNSYGILPNDRTHAIKAYGYYEFTQEWSMGFNALLQSGRPKVCLGTDVDAENGLKDPYGATYGGPGYGPEYFWCGGKPAPRGSLGRLPTEKRLDLALAYNPSFLKDLTLKVDVFNVFNSKTVLARQETYDDGSGEGVLPNYGEARDIAAPRSVKFSAQFNHKF